MWPRPWLAEARPARPRSQLGCRPAGRARSLHPQQVAALEVPRRTASETAQQQPQQGFTALPSTRSTTDQSYWTRRLLCYHMPSLDLTNVCFCVEKWVYSPAVERPGPGRQRGHRCAQQAVWWPGRNLLFVPSRGRLQQPSRGQQSSDSAADWPAANPALHHHTRASCPLAW